MKLMTRMHMRIITATYETSISDCDVLVSDLPQQKSNMEPPVFHMQHSLRLRQKYVERSFLVKEAQQRSSKGALVIGVAIGCLGLSNLAMAKDQACIDYYTVGESVCKPVASTPVQSVQTSSKPPLISPQEQSEVDKYLANYGKPPREFVEFYLNPTSENATKWVAAYQQLLQKGQDISKAWNQADQLYKTQQQPASLQSPVMEQPQDAPASPLVPAMTPQPSQIVPARSIGAFAERQALANNPSGGVAQTPVNLTYYFSQTCPYCARTTPDLSVISNEMAGKLAFTCVDVTPLSPTNQPNEAYITSKLPCNWRLPEEGEVEREGIRQTPTLVIQKTGQSPLRLSGYVPLAQLRTYF